MAGGEPVLCLRCGPLLWWSWTTEAVSVVSGVLSSHREQASRREIRQPDDSFGGRCRVFGALIGQFANARVLGSPNCFGAVASRRFQAPHIHQTEFLACSIAYLGCCVTRDIYFGGQAAETESEPTPTENASHAAIQSRQSPSEQHRLACPVAVPPDLGTASASIPNVT